MEIDRKLNAISKRYKQLQHEYHDMTTTIAQLTQKGCLDASEHWRDGKYLYLIFPMKNGVRRRDYIGSHPLRIEEAREKIENFKIRQEIIEIQTSVNRILCEIETEVSSLTELCVVSQDTEEENVNQKMLVVG